VLDTHQNLAACFGAIQVWLQDWRMRDDGWCRWHHHGDCVELKMKMDGSMRRVASDSSTLKSLFSMY
jgi:hypothetical protein